MLNSLMMNSILQQIQIVDVQSIIPFECSLVQVEPINLLPNLVRNPFPVIRIHDSFLLLDDTDLFEALVRQGLRHLPVQVIPEELVSVRPTNLGLQRYAAQNLHRTASARPEMIKLADSGDCQTGFVPALVTYADDDKQWLHLRHSGSVGCPTSLMILMREIVTIGDYFVLSEHADHQDAVIRYPRPDATLTLPPFTLEDIKSAALSERYFPVGMIRVSSGCRIFNLDFPITVLCDDISTDEKQAFVRELVWMRERAHKTAIIDGRVYLLNR